MPNPLTFCQRQLAQIETMRWLATLKPLEPRTICKDKKPDGCKQPLLEDGYCHNAECNVEKRLNSLYKADPRANPVQRQINYAIFRRFLSD